VDYQLYEWVRTPFEESRARLSRGQPLPEEGIFQGYQQLIAFGRRLVKKFLPNDKLADLYNEIERSLQQYTGAPGMASVRLPVLYNEVVDDFIKRSDSAPRIEGAAEARRASIALFCAIYVECSDQPLGVDSHSSAMAAAIEAEIASYVAWKAFAAIKTNTDLELSQAIARAEERLQSLTGSAQDHLQNALRRTGELQAQDTVLREKLKETVGSITPEINEIRERAAAAHVVFERVLEQSKENESRISLSQESIQRHADAVREELQIDTTKKLWKSRARWGTASFWSSSLVIFAAFAAPILMAYKNVDGIIEILRHIGDAATRGLPPDATTAQLTTATISRLVIITIPLAIYFWAIKLLVRFNARSMMLMDDARQRETMMDVYFHLIEKNGATPEERALVLNALFRPAPGHGSENIDPPNFTELLNKTAAKP
jgi:hypothetical protein